MVSFQAKIVWKMPRKWENKNYSFVPSLPDAEFKIPKKLQKNSKIQKMSVWLHLKPKNVGKGREREKIKIIVLFCSYPTRNRNFQKNSKKIQRIKKSQFGYIISQNSTEKNEKKSPLWYHFKPKFFGKCQESEKIKIIVSFRPYLTHNLKFQKNCKKIKKIKICRYVFI